MPENTSTIQDIIIEPSDPKLLLENNTYWDLTIKNGEFRIDELLKNYRNVDELSNDIKLISVITGDTPSNISRQGDRVYSISGKSPCLTTSQKIKVDCGSDDVYKWRFLSAAEHERLQTVPDGYTIGVSEAQRYRMLGNGYSDRDKARTLLVSDSRPLSTPVKMLHRYFNKGFTTLIFKSEEHYIEVKKHFDLHFKDLSAKEIDQVCIDVDLSIYEGLRYMVKSEREACQTVPIGYTNNLTENEAADLLGDGWTVDVIAHIFKNMKYEK